MRSRGFTLIEMMIAITILAVVIGMVYASFDTSVDSIERARVSAEEMRLRQFVAQSLQRNLTAAYIAGDASQPYFVFEGVDDGSGDQGKDALEFCSSAPLAGGLGLPGDLKRVRYEVVDAQENTAEEDVSATTEQKAVYKQLQVTETPLSAGGFETDDSDAASEAKDRADNASGENPTSSEDLANLSPSWTVPIRSMNIDYFNGQQWQDQWDSAGTGVVPWCVRIRINFAKTDEEVDEEKEQGIDLAENPDFEVVVPIPMGEGVTPKDSFNSDDSFDSADADGT